jgi:hypothetical protein
MYFYQNAYKWHVHHSAVNSVTDKVADFKCIWFKIQVEGAFIATFATHIHHDVDS